MLTLKVSGMSGLRSRSQIIEAVHAIDGEANVQVDLENGIVNVQSYASILAIRAAIEKSGHEVRGETQSARN